MCEDCTTRDCIQNDNRNRFDKRSCPSLLRPFNRAPSDGCVLCMQCVKVCPSRNMGFGMVSPGAPVRRKALLRPFEAAFVMVALGFVSHEVIEEVDWLDSLFHYVPEHLAALVPTAPFVWVEASWFLVLFPLAVWAVIACLAYMAGHRAGLRSLLLAAATGAAPVVAVAHLAKASAKLSSWGGFLPLSIRDPHGLDTFHQLAGHSMSTPSPMFGLSVLGWVMLVVIIIMAFKAWRWARQVPPEMLAAARCGLVSAMLLFSTTLAVWAVRA